VTLTAPVSYAQRRTWIMPQRDPAGGHCNVCRVLRLRGKLDVPKLERALDALARRHASLRTAFTADGETQVVADDATPVLHSTRLDALRPEKREAAIRRLAIDDARRPFDLARAPLMRAHLLHVDDDDHVLLFAVHNLVCDGWSLGLLFRELAQRYGDENAGASPCPDDTLSYAEFATRQRRRAEQGEDGDALAWWKDALADPPPPLRWPAAATPRSTPRYDAGRLKAHPARALEDAIAGTSRRVGVTRFTTWLAACLVLVGRTTGRDRFLVGTLHAGRTQVETRSVVGPFADFLVLRVDLAGDPGFKALLRRTQALMLAAFERQDLPFQRLVDEALPGDDAADVPYFDTVINYTGDRQRIPRRWGGLDVEAVDVDACSSRFRWMLYIRDQDPLALEFVHRTDQMPDADAIAFLDRYQRVLEQACRAPDRPISEILVPT
jgi:hypothetical protein